MSSEPQVRVFPSDEALFRAAAEKFREIGTQAIREHGKYTVALSGGSTPRGLHHEIVTNFSSALPWKKVFFFWGDERHVPPDFPESNFRMAKETLLSKLPVPADNIFRMPGELPDATRARAFTKTLCVSSFTPLPGHYRALISTCSAWDLMATQLRCFLAPRG